MSKTEQKDLERNREQVGGTNLRAAPISEDTFAKKRSFVKNLYV